MADGRTTRRAARRAPTEGPGPRRRASRRCASGATASASRSSTSRASRSTGAQVALYTARPDGTRAARAVSRRARSRCASSRSSSEPDDQRATSTTSTASTSPTCPLPRARAADVVTALAQLDGRMLRHERSQIERSARAGAPPRRRRARDPRPHRRRAADVGGDLAAHRHAHAAARELLQDRLRRRARQASRSCSRSPRRSCARRRVCGPVVDVVAQVRATRRRTWRSSSRRSTSTTSLDKGFRPQVARWRLPTEPWTFVIDRARAHRRALRGRLLGRRAPARGREGRGLSAVARPRLAADLRRLGVREGGVLMVHTRMSALGWVVGGSETVVRALLDALGPEGTLAAYASWEDHVYVPEDRPAAHRDAYVADPPVFDPATAAVTPDYGRIPERLRTWPGARHSGHPEAGVVAVGARAGWLTRPHPDDDAYGAGTPFARLVEAGGQVLMLGAPLDTVTLLHHAEAIARAAPKRRVTSACASPVRDGARGPRVHRHRHGARRLRLRLARPRRRRVRRHRARRARRRRRHDAAGWGRASRTSSRRRRSSPSRRAWLEERFG